MASEGTGALERVAGGRARSVLDLVFRPPARVLVRGAHRTGLAGGHLRIEPLDRAAAGALEKRRHQRMDQARDAARNHRQPESDGDMKVLGVALADAARVRREPAM